ncbi:MAG: hypothetical protein LIO65_07555 [Odoribacter sp.]|nr:hypothetical protein [Odoribacter sp.]
MPYLRTIGAIITNMVTMNGQADLINGGVDNVSLYTIEAIKDVEVALKVRPIVARLRLRN